MAAVGNYYNWLQPAIEHLGVTRTGLGATKVSPNFVSNNDWSSISTYWPSNRQIIRNIASIPTASNGTNNTFNYGPQTYASASLNADGTIASWNQAQGATASFTNVAIVNIDGENATLEGAAQVRTDSRNNVLTWPNSTRTRYAVDYIQLTTENVVKGQARYNIHDHGTYAADNNYYVNAVDTTEYYIAYNGDVLYFQGYQNMPALNSDTVGRIHAAYAVAKDTSADNAGQPYWVADVIVYEVDAYNAPGSTSISLAYYNPNRNTSEIQYLDTLSDKATPADVDLVPKNLNWGADKGSFGNYSGYGFYKLANPSSVEDGKMTATGLKEIVSRDYAGTKTNVEKGFNKNGIFAGTIIRVYVLAGSSYIDINTDDVDVNGTKVVRDATGALPAGTQLRTNVSLKLDNNIYSITEQVVNEGTWNQIVRNVAGTLRYDGRQGYVANSQVKPNDRVIWVGSAPTNGTVGGSSFIIDLGNDITAGDDANAGLHAITPDWLFNRTLAADGVVGEINEQTHGAGLWKDIMDEQTTAAPLGDAPTVTFFGQSVNTVAGTTITVNAAYSQAVANDKTGADVSVKDGKLIIWNGVNVTDSNRETLLDLTVKATGDTYKATVLGDNGLYYDVTLTQAPAASGAKFAAGGIVKTANGGANSLNTPTALSYTPILTWLKSATLDAASQNANVEWTVTLTGGVTLTGKGAGAKLTTLTASDGKNYNETSNDTVASVSAVVTSEDGKTVTYYATAAVGTFTVDIGEGIRVYDATNTWDGTFTGTQSTAFNTTTRKLTVSYGSTDWYQLVANAPEGEWTATGAADMYLKDVAHGMSFANCTFSGPATVTFTAPENPTVLNVKLGAGCGTTTPTTTTAQVSEYKEISKIGDAISMKIEAATGYHVAKVTWANGTKSGEAVALNGTYWQIPADVTRDMTSGDLYINVEVALNARDLKITNSTGQIVKVTYFDAVAGAYQTSEIAAATTTEQTISFSSLGVITIEVVGVPNILINASGTPATSQPVADAPDAVINGNKWESNGMTGTGDITVTVSVPTP